MLIRPQTKQSGSYNIFNVHKVQRDYGSECFKNWLIYFNKKRIQGRTQSWLLRNKACFFRFSIRIRVRKEIPRFNNIKFSIKPGKYYSQLGIYMKRCFFLIVFVILPASLPINKCRDKKDMHIIESAWLIHHTENQ